MYGVGDTLAQSIERYQMETPYKGYSYERTLILAGFGAFNAGPLMKIWYKFLDKSFGTETNFKSGFKKMAMDQILFAPIFLLDFLVMTEIIKHRSFTTVNEKIEKDYYDIMVTNYKIWPIVQLVNMSLVPLNYRILVINIVAVMFNTYLSYRINN
ncbi:unnamed protein product [Gordionus sp. m RMFG-2023]